MKKTTLHLTVAALGSALVLCTGHALADSKTYTALSCLNSNNMVSSFGVFTNSASIPSPLDPYPTVYTGCAIDTDLGGVLTTSSDTFIYVQDGHSSQNISCQLYSRDMTTGSYSYVSAASSGVDSAPTFYYFTGANYSNSSTKVRRYLYCSVPGRRYSTDPMSSIHGYGVDET